MSSTALQRLSPEEYLTSERASVTKHEFYDGQVFAMAGTSAVHNTICMNLARIMGNALAGKPCRPFGMDLRVNVSASGFYTYPDVIVVCDKPASQDSNFDTLLNPKVLFEVLSPSTESFDRGRKFALYQEIDSLTDYVIVSQDMSRVEHFEREDADHWRLSVYESLGQTVRLQSIECDLPMAEIFDRVEFGPPPPLREPTELDQ